MSDLSNGWLAKNQQQQFPLDPRATGLTDDGRPLPTGLLADLSLTGYMPINSKPFITAIRSDLGGLSVAIGFLDYRTGLLTPTSCNFAVVTIAKNSKTGNNDKLAVFSPTDRSDTDINGRLFALVHGKVNSGTVAMGDPSIIFSGVFSSPQQTELAAATYRYVQVLPELNITPDVPTWLSRRISHFAVNNIDSGVRSPNLTGVVTLESGLDIAVTTVSLLTSSGSPVLTPTGTPKRAIVVTGGLNNNLLYLPRTGMADEDDCSASGYPPAIRTVGGVSPKATPQGGELIIEFVGGGPNLSSGSNTATDAYDFTLPGNITSTRYTAELLNVITVGTSVPFGELCKTPIPKPVPVTSACADVADEVCDGVHTFGQIPVDWSVVDDLPLSSSVPRLKPNGDPCPAIETLEDELVTDYSAEFGTCFAPVARGQSICQRWYSRRVWAFDQTTQLDKIQIGSLGMAYAPTDWSAHTDNTYSSELKAAFLGMPLRNYLNRSIVATFRLDPSGPQYWSWSELVNPSASPFSRPVLRALGAVILDASVDTPFGTDWLQPPSPRDDGLRRIESILTFGIVYGSMTRYDDFVGGRPAFRTGYWLVQSGNNAIQPALLLLETSNLSARTVMLTIFGQRDTVSHEIYGTVSWTIPNLLGPPAAGTHAFRTAAWSRWAGEQPITVTPQTAARFHIGFSIGPNSTIMALEA